MNNAEILAMLGGSGLAGPSSNRREEGKSLLSFKAGKMDPVLQPNGKYLITADARRGQVSLTFILPTSTSTSTLTLEFKDRRTRSVVESFTIIPEDQCSIVPISTGRPNSNDRVYMLQFGSHPDRRFFFWMQEKYEEGVDEQQCVDMNKFISSVNECILAAGGVVPPPSSSSTATTQGSSSNNTTNTSTANVETSNPTSSSLSDSQQQQQQQQQVDALSNILENLGMPQPNPASSSSSSQTLPTSTSAFTSTTTNNTNTTITNTTTTTTSAPSTTPSSSTKATGGTLTLADLQGAMAGLATTSPVGSTSATTTSNSLIHPTPPLTELASMDAIEESGILKDSKVVQHLMEYLPPSQRTEAFLKENLRSPQVQQALHSLTLALVGDHHPDDDDDEDGGSGMESYHSIIANFQLSAEDGAIAMASGNPIQAFLDCLLASVQKKEEEEDTKANEEEEE